MRYKLTTPSIAADSILTNLTTNQNGQLRRLLISCPGEDLDTVAHHHPFRGMGYGNAGGYTSYYQVQPQIARLRELSELFIGGCPKGPLMLHDANKGLTKLFLKDVTTTAKHLIDIATKGFGGASPLVELAMSNVNLDNVFHHGITYREYTAPPLLSLPSSAQIQLLTNLSKQPPETGSKSSKPSQSTALTFASSTWDPTRTSA